MEHIKFEHYFAYEELTSILQECAAKYPKLMKLSSICTTPKGREVWAAEITNLDTGDFLSKPAYYVDGNHHAGEVTGSMAAMYTLVHVLSHYGSDKTITKLLDENTLYVIPRISPDGAQAYLTSAEKLRSVDRPYPFEKPEPGLHPSDIDGDGVIRMMRVPSATGPWKESENDCRVMVKRQPADFGGTYYEVYPEGHIVEYDGLTVSLAPNKWGLDFNRNYPFGWFAQVRQPGAGAYPLSNAENKAVADFVLSHPNIGSADTHHTTGGVLVYPPGTKPEKEGNKRDMRMFREVGKMGTQEMGYACVNIFDNFLPDQASYSSGAFDDWMYQTQGIPAYTTELWDLQIRAGVEGVWPRTTQKPKTDDEKAEDFAKVLKWIDENVGKDACKAWTKFDHPQLGAVEIGGYDFKFNVQNPPPAFLEQELKKANNYVLRHAQVLPKVSLQKLDAQQIAPGVYKIEAVIGNQGYLPTFICEEALSMQVDVQPLVTVQCDGELVQGEATQKLGHLEGISGIDADYGYDGLSTNPKAPLKKKLCWTLKAQAGSTLTLTVQSPKIGLIKNSITL